jgi:uncharacterized protein DUF6898
LRRPVEKPILRASESHEAAMTGKAAAGEVIIEMRPVGSVVRVAAVDVASGTEVVVFGPATTPPRALEELAVAKLKRRLSTDRGP